MPLDIVSGQVVGVGGAAYAPPKLTSDLLDWMQSAAYRVVSATRDANEAIVTASIVWPDRPERASSSIGRLRAAFSFRHPG